MVITVLYDSHDNDITYKSVQFILNQIKAQNINTSIKEFFITEKIVSNYLQCYPYCKYYCMYDYDASECEYLTLMNNISLSLNKSDFIILSSSSKKHRYDTEMYKLLETLSYKWMPHKTNSHMINKLALAISSTSPIIMFSHTNMIFSRILRLWGINKHSIFSKSLSKYNKQPLTEQANINLNSDLKKLSTNIVNKYRKTSAVIVPNFNNDFIAPKCEHNKNSVIKLPDDTSTKKILLHRFKNKRIL